MKLEIEIFGKYEELFKKDRFKEYLWHASYDAHCAGSYKEEDLIDNLICAFEDAKIKDKFLFLDVDEVLNSLSTTRKTKSGNHNFVDVYLVRRIQNIVEKTGAKIILSSAWRLKKEPSEEELDCYFELISELKKFDIKIFDQLGEKRWNRGIEIKEWFEKQKLDWKESAFIIIDDQPPQEFDDLRGHVIMVNGKEGISESDADEAIKRLNS